MNKAEKEHKVLDFQLLSDIDYLPNLCVDRNGNLFLNTRKLYEMFDSYLHDVEFVKTEIAQLTRERFLSMQEIAESPLSKLSHTGE